MYGMHGEPHKSTWNNAAQKQHRGVLAGSVHTGSSKQPYLCPANDSVSIATCSLSISPGGHHSTIEYVTYCVSSRTQTAHLDIHDPCGCGHVNLAS
ncbi:hypothetical protein IAQ61_004779 [Plenodomus lingam]|uniref:uncharacterized protein n=1 Tax=Leptosphaeria maculans TaxID=5022 RepID=UPI0033204151|nr:hypothetical protein IAQ61_004779 [Plenodomus lingam]